MKIIIFKYFLRFLLFPIREIAISKVTKSSLLQVEVKHNTEYYIYLQFPTTGIQVRALFCRFLTPNH